MGTEAGRAVVPTPRHLVRRATAMMAAWRDEPSFAERQVLAENNTLLQERDHYRDLSDRLQADVTCLGDMLGCRWQGTAEQRQWAQEYIP